MKLVAEMNRGTVIIAVWENDDYQLKPGMVVLKTKPGKKEVK